MITSSQFYPFILVAAKGFTTKCDSILTANIALLFVVFVLLQTIYKDWMKTQHSHCEHAVFRDFCHPPSITVDLIGVEPSILVEFSSPVTAHSLRWTHIWFSRPLGWNSNSADVKAITQPMLLLQSGACTRTNNQSRFGRFKIIASLSQLI